MTPRRLEGRNIKQEKRERRESFLQSSSMPKTVSELYSREVERMSQLKNTLEEFFSFFTTFCYNMVNHEGGDISNPVMTLSIGVVPRVVQTNC